MTGTDLHTREQRDQALFDRIAGHYSAKDRYAPSAKARKLRLLQTLRLCPGFAGKDILEVGCGAGFTASYLEGQYRSFTGIDYSQQLIDHANQLHRLPNTTFQQADLYTFEPGRRFDLAIMVGVLHHMPDMPGALARIRDLLVPGGYLVANEPQRSNPVVHLLRSMRARMDGSYSDEQEELRSSDLLRMFAVAGFEQVSIRPQGVFSTPFAEVPMRPSILAGPASAIACATDRLLEAGLGSLLKPLAWNTVIVGRRGP